MKALKLLLVLCLLVTLLPSGVVADTEVDEVTILSGEKKTVSVDVGNATVEAIQTTGPLTVVGQDVNNGRLTLKIRGDRPKNPTKGNVHVALSNGERRIDVQIVPYEQTNAEQNKVNTWKESHQELNRVESQWIQKEVDRKQTGEGTLIVYRQLDPTKGEIDPETGIPEGKWVQVETTAEGDPIWLFNNTQEAYAYMAKNANENYDFRRNMTIGSVSVIALILISVFVVLPKYRQRQEMEKWSENDEWGNQ